MKNKMKNDNHFSIAVGISKLKLFPRKSEIIKVIEQTKLITKLDLKGILILLVSYDKAAINVSNDKANIKVK